MVEKGGIMMKIKNNKNVGLVLLGLLCSFAALIQASPSSEICPSPLPKQYKHAQAGNIVAAYVANWDVSGANQFKIESIEKVAHQLTHIIYAFMKPDDQTGTCKPSDNLVDIGAIDGVQDPIIGGNFAELLKLKKKFPHLKIILSIGGGVYNKNFITIAQDPKLLKNFTQSCVDILDFYDHTFTNPVDQSAQTTHFTYKGLFDGLDIDWEWSGKKLTPELSQTFTKFIHDLKHLLHARDRKTKKKSMLAVALQVTPHVYKTLDLHALSKDVDFFNVMSYDFFGPYNETIGFNAPICGKWSVYSIDGALQRIMELGVSPEKMVLGLPLYGHVYENTDGYNSKIGKKDKIRSVAYRVIKNKYMDNPDFKESWHDHGQVPSLYSLKHRTFVSHDEEQSLTKKVEFAKLKKLQGVFLWRLPCDDEQFSMLKVVADAMKN